MSIGVSYELAIALGHIQAPKRRQPPTIYHHAQATLNAINDDANEQITQLHAEDEPASKKKKTTPTQGRPQARKGEGGPCMLPHY